MTTLDNDLRLVFVSGTNCAISACDCRSFNSINTTWKHLEKVHKEKVPLFKRIIQKTDGLCSFTSTQVGDVRKHII